jgi:PEP-CTERM motif
VQPNDPLTGDFRYATLSATITLAGGATCIIGGPNFIYEPLPEPSTCLMMVLGLAAIGAVSARRHR